MSDQGYTPNQHLQLTLPAEVERLKKVIAEKNALIAKFKQYDEERKAHYRRFEQNYAMMEERFDEFLDAVNSCDEIDDGTKEFYEGVVMRLYKGKVTSDKKKSVLQLTLAVLLQMEEGFGNLEWLMADVGNVEKRAALLNELRRQKFRYEKAVRTFRSKMGELK